MNLVKPVDFKKFGYLRVTNQVKWLDIDWSEIRRSIPNLITAGVWRKNFECFRNDNGIAKAIIDYRKKKICPPRCLNRGHKVNCDLFTAIKHEKSNEYKITAFEECNHAVPLSNFEDSYTKFFRFNKNINKMLKDSYSAWRLWPYFYRNIMLNSN